MPGNERLSLEIGVSTVGEAAVDKLAASIEKVVNIASKKPNNGEPHKTGYEDFPAKLKEFVEAPLQSATSALGEFSKGFGAVGIAVAGTIGAIGAIAAASYEAAKSLGELGVQNQRLSIITGLSTREVGLYSFAAKAAGSDISVLEGTVRKLSQGLADGGLEGKNVSDALTAAGVSTRSLNGDILPMGEIFNQIGEAMQHMSGAAERNAFAVKALGRAGLEAVPMFMGMKENLSDADKIGLGVSDSEQTKFLDIYKKKIEEVDGAWSVAMRHFKEGISGTIWMDISGAGAAAFNYLATGGAIAADRTKRTPINPKDLQAPAWQTSIRDASLGIVEAPTDWSKVRPADSLEAIVNGWGPGGDPIVAAFLARQTKEGISANIEKLRSDNSVSMATLNAKGPGAEAKRQAVDSINANQKIIDRLHDQLKQIEESTSEMHANAKKLSDLRKEGHSFITFGSGKNQTVITDDEINKAGMDARGDRLRLMPPSLDGPENWRGQGDDRPYLSGSALGLHLVDVDKEPAVVGREEIRKNVFGDAIGAFAGGDSNGDSFVRSNSDLDALNKRGFLGISRMQAEAGSAWFSDSSHRDDLAMRGINDTAERQARMAGIGARPEDALAVAAKQRDIRLQAIADDQATLLLSKNRYNITDKMYALEQRAQDAQIEYNEKVANQLAKQQEQFRSIAGSLFDSFFGGSKGVSSFFKSQAEGIGKTIFQNAAQLGEKQIMGAIPHANSGILGTLLKGTPFGPDPMKQAGVTLNTAGDKLIMAANRMNGGPSGGGSIGASSLGGDLPMLRSISTGLPSGITDSSDVVSEIDPSKSYGGILPSNSSAMPKIGSTTGDLMAGAAAITGVISGIKAFGGSGSGGVQGKLDGVGGILASASVVTSLIKGVASSIPIVGSIVAAALPIIGSFFPNGPQHRENQISHELTDATYQAPTALKEMMSTRGTYQDFDARGNLRNSNFSATPQVLDPFIYWARGNVPVQSPGSVTSPYGAPVTPTAPAPNITIHMNSIDSQSGAQFLINNAQAVGAALTAHIQSGGAQHLVDHVRQAL
jgi:hypothetical protein